MSYFFFYHLFRLNFSSSSSASSLDFISNIKTFLLNQAIVIIKFHFNTSSWYNEKSLEDRCFGYWQKYMKSLSKSEDGKLLLEQSQLNSHRSRWRDGLQWINCLYRSKRYVPRIDVLGQALRWMEMHGTADSVVDFIDEELLCFALFPETF
jgi:hypothetical protein